MILYQATLNHYGTSDDLEFEVLYYEYKVIRETEKFYVVEPAHAHHGTKTTRVAKQGKKVKARATKREAYLDLIARNRFYIQILKEKLWFSKKIKAFLEEEILNQNF